MPELKISPAQEPPKSQGIPPFMIDYAIHLNADHLSANTLKTLHDNVSQHKPSPDLGESGIIVTEYSHKTCCWHSGGICVDFRGTEDEKRDISALPPDLRECVLYAARMGFNQIQFEYAHPDDIPYLRALPIYNHDNTKG